jgi:hypothetical protein
LFNVDDMGLKDEWCWKREAKAEDDGLFLTFQWNGIRLSDRLSENFYMPKHFPDDGKCKR